MTGATQEASGKRRQPFAYPASPNYTTEHPSMHAHMPSEAAQYANANRNREFSQESGTHPPTYRADSQDEHSLEKQSHRRRSSSKLSKFTARGAYAMHNLNNRLPPPTSHGYGIESRPMTGFTASSRPMSGSATRTHTGVTEGIDLDKEGLDLQYMDEEEDSPYPEVRASVSNIDDPEMPVLTFRAWFMGLFFCTLGGCLNFFFNIRYPSPIISPVTVQVISYPFGKFLAYILPTKTWTIPKQLKFLGFPDTFSFNPGPFNIKEHAIVVIMANVTLAPAYALNLTLVLDKFYQAPKGIGFDFLIVLSTQIVGFSFAGLCRRYLVWPASLVWPQNLVTCTLFNTFHAEDDDGSDGSLTRFRFFIYAVIGAFIWFWLPGEWKTP